MYTHSLQSSVFLRDWPLSTYVTARGIFCMLLLALSGDVRQLFENGSPSIISFFGGNLGGVASRPGLGSILDWSDVAGSILILPGPDST